MGNAITPSPHHAITPFMLVQLNRYELGYPWLFHRHAVQAIGDLHGFAVVRDENELGVSLHTAQHLHEPADIRIVERRVDLIEQTERTWLVLKQPEHERDCRERLLAAGQQLHALQGLAWRLRDDFDAALERIALVEQGEAGAAAAKESTEGEVEVVIDCRERLRKALAGRLIDALDGFAGPRDGVDEILALRR